MKTIKLPRPDTHALGFVGTFGKKDTKDLMEWILWGDKEKTV